ncbi:MAG: hypothetical protein FWG03_11710, partial [Clostridiales bacterium]|nr:hypothetical protein [Clostridiales bacterium]
MKKILLFALAAVMCIALAACTSDTPAAPEPAQEPEAEAPVATEPEPEAPAGDSVIRVAVSLPPADNAWQAALKRSMEEAVAGDTEIEWLIKNANDDVDQTNMLTTFKDGGYDLIACLPG